MKLYRRAACLGIAAVLAGTVPVIAQTPSGAGKAAGYTPSQPIYGTQFTKSVRIVMKDGIVLKANLTVPTDKQTGKPAKGPFPVLLTETPYSKDGALGAVASAATAPATYFAQRGYIGVDVDVRGTGGSSGVFTTFDPQQSRDSVEIVKWCSRLPNSTGEVGMYGISYGGDIQYMTASAVGPHSPLKAIWPEVASNDSYRDQGYPGGLQNGGFATPYNLALVPEGILTGPVTDADPNHPDRPGELAETEVQHVAGVASNNFGYQVGAMAGREQYDEGYWQVRNPANMLRQIVANGIPAFQIGGWWDLLQRGMYYNWLGLQNAAAHRSELESPLTARQKLDPRWQIMFGPWYHGQMTGMDRERLELRWFDTWLKHTDTGMDRPAAPFHYWDMGTGGWHTAGKAIGSVDRTKTFYFGAGSPNPGESLSTNNGTLTTAKPKDSTGADPILWTGGSSPCTRNTEIQIAGLAPLPEQCIGDDRSFAAGNLSYQTEPLGSPLHLAGPIGVTLYATSTTKETEWIATVEDVAPDGSIRAVSNGALRGAMREVDRSRSWIDSRGNVVAPFHPYTEASLKLVPTGEVVRYDLEVFPIAWTLAKGHSLRVTVTTGQAPNIIPPSDAVPNLVGGLYQVQRTRVAASSVTLTLSNDRDIVDCQICRIGKN